MVNKRYWPFDVPSAEQLSAEDKRAVGFLESAFCEGFQSFDCEGMVLGASATNGREGEIVRRGGRGRYWEVVFAENGEVVSSLFIDGFEIAANAVLRWLRGEQYSNIFLEIKHAVVTKPGGRDVL